MKLDAAEFFPTHVLKDKNIEISIWRVHPENPPTFSARVARIYRADGECKYSNLFTEDELSRLSRLAADAHAWMSEQRSRNQNND